MRKQHAALKTRLRHKTCLFVFCNYTKCEGHGPKKKHRECNTCGLIEGHCFNPQIALLQQQSGMRSRLIDSKPRKLKMDKKHHL